MPSERGLDQDRLKSLIDYDPDTGIFTWKARTDGGRGWRRSRVGQTAGTPCLGYVQIQVDGRLHKAHRLAFLFMTGSTPAIVDHVNCDRADNRWANLRAADHTLNKANTHRRRNNSSGRKGVFWHGQVKKWRARLHVYGRVFELGCYDRIEDAAEAYAAAAKSHYGEFARTA